MFCYSSFLKLWVILYVFYFITVKISKALFYWALPSPWIPLLYCFWGLIFLCNPIPLTSEEYLFLVSMLYIIKALPWCVIKAVAVKWWVLVLWNWTLSWWQRTTDPSSSPSWWWIRRWNYMRSFLCSFLYCWWEFFLRMCDFLVVLFCLDSLFLIFPRSSITVLYAIRLERK